jgi:toxin ParE1/3/4
VSHSIWHHPRANDDLLEIWLFIARDNIRAADKLIAKIAQKCDRLADFPELGRARPDIAPEVRMLTVGNYLVLYRIGKQRVEIVRVVHGAPP